jgi:hypothetical protein
MFAGFKWSIIDYAQKIEGLFAKMEGVRSAVLPPNREAVDRYFAFAWEVVHTLTAAVLSESSQPSGLDESKKFKSYLEAEEARLGNNLQAVGYIIDGVDTLPLITGVGRVEKVRILTMHTATLDSFVLQTLFPLLYVLMKHHYEIMRIMCTKILNMRELLEGVQGILYINEAVADRVQSLTRMSVSSSSVVCNVNLIHRQLHSAETRSREAVSELRFWDCRSFIFFRISRPFDMLVIQFKYYHNVNSLWSVDYVRGLHPRITPYNDDNEDQNVQPGDLLKHEYKDELCLDYSVYEGRSTDHIPNCCDVDSPMKDMYAPSSYYSHASQLLTSECAAVWEFGTANSTMTTDSTGKRPR